MRTKIKICGITRPQDAMLAEQLGADYLGFIFAPSSPRYIAPMDARAITAQLTRAVPVGVFVDTSVDETLAIAHAAGLKAIQHYQYHPGAFRDYSYICAMRMGAPDMPADWSLSAADYVLVDSYDAHSHGGTGKTFDWSALAGQPMARLFLAGGIGAHNLGAALRLSPFAVDLSSAVESAPGQKHPLKLQQLFETYHAYFEKSA
jgi:phosphoribosylanthranilate isomerase